MTLTDVDHAHLVHAVDLAAQARYDGNHPFGALLAAPGGPVVEAVNTVVTKRDPTGHAETNLVRIAAATMTSDELAAATLYTSTEPCAMCAGAIYWAGIGRVVFALAETDLIAIVTDAGPAGVPTLDLPCREVFARGGRAVTVEGPVDLPAARAVHAGFWG